MGIHSILGTTRTKKVQGRRSDLKFWNSPQLSRLYRTLVIPFFFSLVIRLGASDHRLAAIYERDVIGSSRVVASIPTLRVPVPTSTRRHIGVIRTRHRASSCNTHASTRDRVTSAYRAVSSDIQSAELENPPKRSPFFFFVGSASIA